MRNTSRYGAILAFLFVIPSSAHAYLDPGTGSMIIQVMIGAVAGAILTLKLYGSRFKRFLLRVAGKNTENHVGSPPQEEVDHVHRDSTVQ